jgi:hypothetical protein
MSLLTSKMIRSGLTFVMAAGAFSTMSGCTNNEVAASALVIGAAAIVTADDSPAPHRHRRDRYVPRYDRHRGPHRHDLAGEVQSSALSAAVDAASKATSPAAASFKSADARVIALAENYDISHYAATYLVRAIVLAQAKDTSGIEALGLSVGDFKELYEGKELEAAKIETLGAKLKMDAASTEQLVADMTVDVQAEKAARGL